MGYKIRRLKNVIALSAPLLDSKSLHYSLATRNTYHQNHIAWNYTGWIYFPLIKRVKIRLVGRYLGITQIKLQSRPSDLHCEIPQIYPILGHRAQISSGFLHTW